MYETVQYGSGELYGQRGGVSFARAKCTQRGATIADRKVCLTKIIKEGKRGAISPGAGLAIEMETLEACRICRLCGNHSEISINIFDKKAAIIDKIHAVLPISVHEMDMLPKQMCHRCSYKLEEFHKFYFQCIKTDNNLKSQLSWMRKEKKVDEIVSPMVHFGNFKIKNEPVDSDCLEEFAQIKPTRLGKSAVETFAAKKCCRCYHGQECPNVRLHASQKKQIHNKKCADNSRTMELRNHIVNLNKNNSKVSPKTPQESLQSSSKTDLRLNEEPILNRLRNPLSRNSASFQRPNLRSRGTSVGTVETKKKIPRSSRTQSETRELEAEPEEVKEYSRALRPRKTNVSSFKQSVKRPRPMDARNPKRFKENPMSITIKQEVQENLNAATLPLDKSKENRLKKDDTAKSKVKITSNVRVVNKVKNKMEVVQPAFSASRLMRSQVVRLRSGKAKSREGIVGPGNFGERGVRLQKETEEKIKQFCERCNVSYVNNKRHKCSGV